MDRVAANPLLVALLFILRCAVPLLIMIGISYLLRKLGLIAEPPKPPADYASGNNNNSSPSKGDLTNG